MSIFRNLNHLDDDEIQQLRWMANWAWDRVCSDDEDTETKQALNEIEQEFQKRKKSKEWL